MEVNGDYTKVPNVLLEFMGHFTEAEFKVVLAIARKTIGWGKEKDKISFSQIETMTGISRTAIHYALKTLQADELVLVEGKPRQLKTYSLCKESLRKISLHGYVRNSYMAKRKVCKNSLHTKERLKENQKKGASACPDCGTRDGIHYGGCKIGGLNYEQ